MVKAVWFYHVTSLTHVHMSENDIHTVEPNSFKYLVNLHTLMLQVNDIVNLPFTIFDPGKRIRMWDNFY